MPSNTLFVTTTPTVNSNRLPVYIALYCKGLLPGLKTIKNF